MKVETINQQWRITDNGYEWYASYAEHFSKEKPYLLIKTSGKGSSGYFQSLDGCIKHVEQQRRPPYVELTLADFHVTHAADYAVGYGNNEHGVGFTFLCSELKFASAGTRYNSAAECVAAINAERCKQYDANTSVKQ